MKINLYNQKGEKVGKTDLPDEIFNVEINSDLLHQVIVSQMANKRQSSAHTKDRGDVSGGGKKPWRQKGTGRARHGSRRSPIWVGGGVTFGPKSERNYKKTIPQKMKRKALFMALSSKVNDDELILIDDLGMKEPQARIAQSILEKLPLSDKSGLVVLSEPDKNIVLSFRNIPKTESIQAKDLTALNILSFKKLIMTPDSVVKIKETFLKDNSSKA
ncbi:MAG: 50S ribosomal protein L4 [Minisyncoccales bacterium]|jgi:large subunit ribosomal protein L4